MNYELITLNSLFPFDCCGGFAGDVVDYSVDASDFVYYSIGYYGEDFVGDS